LSCGASSWSSSGFASGAIDMVTAEELLVKITPEGIGETEQELKGVEKSMEDTADSAGDSAEELQGFSEKFAGAMTSAVAALAIGAAGILAQVPVIGETGSAIQAILGSITRSIDREIRPAMNGFNQDLFATAQEAENAEGLFNTLKTAVEGFDQATEDLATDVMQNEIEELTGITVPDNWLDLGWEIITVQTGDAMGTVIDIIEQDIDQAASQVSGLEGAFSDTGETITQDVTDWVDNFINEVRNIPRDVTRFFDTLGENLSEWGGNLADEAISWGQDIIQGIIDGISNGIDDLQETLDELSSISESVDIDLPDFDDLDNIDVAGSIGGSNGGGGGGGGGGGQFTVPDLGNVGNIGNGGDIQLDGRTLIEDTGRFITGSSQRRGL